MFDEDLFKVLVQAVIRQESGGNPNAESPVGAQGIMQVMPATAREVMREIGIDEDKYDPFDAEQNKFIGSYYLRKMLILFGDIRLGLAAYNCGPGRVSRLTAKYGDSFDAIKLYLPSETKHYVANITYFLLRDGVKIT